VLIEGKVSVVARGPSRPTLIYDADCGFCRRWVGRVKKWDRRRELEYLPLQDEKAPLVSEQQRRRLRQAFHLVQPDGVVSAGAEAARQLFSYLPGGWLPRAIMGLPGIMPVARCTYAWIARRWGPAS
jgi:predicted DCC family thiol-disulfide oxidoreductase YuxK